MKRNAFLGIAMLVLGLLALPAAAQSQASASQSGSSLGDYARQIRNDGGVQTKGKPKVFDNDNLPKTDKLSVIGDTAPAATPQNENENKSAENKSAENQPEKAKAVEANGSEAAKANSNEAAKTASPVTSASSKKAEDAKEWADKIAAQKDQVDLLSRELDVTQREYQLRAAAMYADVGNRLRNSAEWDKEDAQYKQQIADKQKAIGDAKQKLDDLQESARKAGAAAPAQ
jgi:hypothetical protein